MNQEQNNLNPNNFNTQGNNGIPNNQPLNNQSFNQGMGFNQQPINPQPQPTPSFQQPIMQEPTPQPTNTFESGNASNQSFNSKPPKKMNLGLIIGIVAAVAVVGVGIVFGSKLLSNGGSNISNNNSSNQQTNKQLEKLYNNNDNIVKTPFVDTYNKLVIEYPTFYTENDNSAFKVMSSVKYPFVKLISVLGDMYLYYPSDADSYSNPVAEKNYSSAKDFFEKYYLPQIQTYKGLVKYLAYYDGTTTSCYECSLKEYKNLKSYEYNDLKWERYNIKIANDTIEKQYEVWITVKDGIPYVMKFDIFGKDENPFNEKYITNETWKNVLDYETEIREDIIKNIKFVNDKQKLLNYKEASVLVCSESWGTSTLSGPNYETMMVPNCRTNFTGFRKAYWGQFVNNGNNISIDEVYNALKSNFPNYDLFTSEYSVESVDESYKLNNYTMGDYEVKKYVIVNNQQGKKHSVYMFKNKDYYGYVYNSKHDDDYRQLNHRILSNELDFAIKNLRFKSDEFSYYWEYDELK